MRGMYFLLIEISIWLVDLPGGDGGDAAGGVGDGAGGVGDGAGDSPRSNDMVKTFFTC
jgi:hypothetical protein